MANIETGSQTLKTKLEETMNGGYTGGGEEWINLIAHADPAKNEKDEYLTEEDYVELGSNHRAKYKEHGEWVKPVFPTNVSLQGSPMTPYIFDDRVQYEDAADAIMSWYLRGPEERERCGELGIKFVKDKTIGMDSKEMCDRFIESINDTFENWKPREKYTLEVI